MKKAGQPARKKPHLTIVPGEGVGPIRFGMKRKDVRAAMAKIKLKLNYSHKAMDYFGRENAVQVEFIRGTASFIGIAAGGLRFTSSIHDVEPFDTPARALFRLLAKHDGAKGAKYNAAEHLFRNTIVTLYDADEQYDHRGGGSRVVWAQVGVGDPRYLAAIDRILS
jgi:hypothetical protein